MTKKEDKNTRYFIDLDLKSRKILNWDYGQRDKLVHQVLEETSYRRIYITRGQYNKLKD